RHPEIKIGERFFSPNQSMTIMRTPSWVGCAQSWASGALSLVTRNSIFHEWSGGKVDKKFGYTFTEFENGFEVHAPDRNPVVARLTPCYRLEVGCAEDFHRARFPLFAYRSVVRELVDCMMGGMVP